MLHQFVDGDFRVVDLGDNAVDNFCEVVRRDIRRHADRNAVAPVDEKVREARRQNARLHAGVVESRIVIDRLFVQIAQHFRREL
mgnify:CR=1 FL=1